MIVSSLKFDSIIVRILKPTTLLSYSQFKNGSLCLDTLYIFDLVFWSLDYVDYFILDTNPKH